MKKMLFNIVVVLFLLVSVTAVSAGDGWRGGGHHGGYGHGGYGHGGYGGPSLSFSFGSGNLDGFAFSTRGNRFAVSGGYIGMYQPTGYWENRIVYQTVAHTVYHPAVLGGYWSENKYIQYVVTPGYTEMVYTQVPIVQHVWVSYGW
jgi:hypothetical protein